MDNSIMADLTFPTGVKYKYNYTPTIDCIPKGFPAATQAFSGYRGAVISNNFNLDTLTNTNSLFSSLSSVLVILNNNKVIDCKTSSTNMFSSTQKLLKVPEVDTSKSTTLYYMFENNRALIDVPELDCSSCTNFQAVFRNSPYINTPVLKNTSKGTSFYEMFSGCTDLIEGPELDTSNATNLGSMFYGCTNIKSIPMYNAGKITGSSYNIFGSTTINSLIDWGGLKDLGKMSNLSANTYMFQTVPNLSKQSILNFINNIYDRASAGYSVITLKFTAAQLAMLTDEEKAIATNKGWTLS